MEGITNELIINALSQDTESMIMKSVDRNIDYLMQ